MSKLNKREYNNLRHPRPIPLPIPLLHISNNYFSLKEVWDSIYDTLSHIFKIGLFNYPKPVEVVFDVYMDLSFKIFDRNSMLFIWNNGFYGKGILSRSDPTWIDRMQKRIDTLLTSKLNDSNQNLILINNNNGDDDNNDNINNNKNNIYSEEITKNRRLLRDAWKKEREALIKLEKNIKLNSVNGEISVDDKKKIDFERERLSKLKEDLMKGPNGVNPDILNNISSNSSRINSPISTDFNNNTFNLTDTSNSNLTPNDYLIDQLRMEDYNVIIDSKHIRNIEYLELDPCETLFLLQLNLINVKINDELIFFDKLLELLIENFGPLIINEYIVYYHFRTLGWCIRNGLKFSCDWVLYSRGPPFSHAEFAIKIINENLDEFDNLTDYQAISRVVSGVKKNLILCFVDGPVIESEEWYKLWNNYLITKNFIDFMNTFTINEISWNRWAPSRTRM